VNKTDITLQLRMQYISSAVNIVVYADLGL